MARRRLPAAERKPDLDVLLRYAREIADAAGKARAVKAFVAVARLQAELVEQQRRYELDPSKLSPHPIEQLPDGWMPPEGVGGALYSDPQLIAKVCRGYRLGHWGASVEASLGLCKGTIKAWRTRGRAALRAQAEDMGPDLPEDEESRLMLLPPAEHLPARVELAVGHAREIAQTRLVDLIQMMAAADFKAAKWMLEKMAPRRWWAPSAAEGPGAAGPGGSSSSAGAVAVYLPAIDGPDDEDPDVDEDEHRGDAVNDATQQHRHDHGVDPEEPQQ